MKLRKNFPPLGFLTFLVGLVPLSHASPVGKFVPPEGKILLVVGQDIKNINGYLKSIKIIPGGFTIYTSVEFTGGLDTRMDRGGGVQFARKLVNRYPDTVLQMGLNMVGALGKVNRGDLDESLDELISWIRKADRPVFLRLGYEFDNPSNQYDPDRYIAAFRTVVDRFREKKVENVAFVWHSYAAYMSRPHLDWYPGDDYVDWLALSYFRQPRPYLDAFADLAKELEKPLMVAESSPWQLPTRLGASVWKDWFVPLFYFMEEKGVQAFSYINCDWDAIPEFRTKNWGDARLQSNRYITQKWIDEISQESYLKSSPRLFEILGFVPSPRRREF